MSKSLLLKMNADARGPFFDWVSNQPDNLKIAWYPSAGDDFRDLLYLSSGYLSRLESKDKFDVPDLFLHTDYYPWQSCFLDKALAYEDERTKIAIEVIDELPLLELYLDPEIVDFPAGKMTGKVLFGNAKIICHRYGEFVTPLLYAFVENTEFCSKVALPNQGLFSHVIRVRYGGGLGGGGKSRGKFLVNVLKILQCKNFITDDSILGSTDRPLYGKYPNVSGPEEMPNGKLINRMDGESWSGYGDVLWYQMEYERHFRQLSKMSKETK